MPTLARGLYTGVGRCVHEWHWTSSAGCFSSGFIIIIGLSSASIKDILSCSVLFSSLFLSPSLSELSVSRMAALEMRGGAAGCDVLLPLPLRIPRGAVEC